MVNYPFPSTPLLETFNVPLSPDRWSDAAYGNGSIVVAGGQATGAVAGWGAAEWIVDDYGPPCEVYCEIPVIGGSGEELHLHLAEDNDSSTFNGYILNIDAGGGNWSLVRVVDGGGAGTITLASGSQAMANGDGVGARRVGAAITAYYRSGSGAYVSLGAGSDTTYPAAGKLGIEIFDNVYRISNFGGGTAPLSLAPPFIRGSRKTSW
jgi:hypothetical protein